MMCLLLAFVMAFGSVSAMPLEEVELFDDAAVEFTPIFDEPVEIVELRPLPLVLDDGRSRLEIYEEMIAAFGTRFHFTDYLALHADALPVSLDQDIIINAADYIIAEGMQVRYYTDFEGVSGTSVWTDEQGLIEWEFIAPQAGLYNISVKYFTTPGRNSDIQRAIFINGQQPFFEASPVELRRTWVNQFDYIQRDALGNDMRPTQIEQHIWAEVTLRDAMGTYNEYFSFFFEEGRNTIGFLALREPLKIRHLRIHQASEPLPYAQLAATRGNLNRPSVARIPALRLEGQDAARKSSPMLAPGADTGGPGVYPYSARYIRINHIGGGSWNVPGSWVEWEFEVPEAGLFSIGMNARQNFHRGANSYRRITVNGEVPFEEMEQVAFPFQNGWRVRILGDNEPYLFWLEEGTNVFRMETVLGEYAEFLREIQESVLNLNEMYRQVVMLTGLTPDRWRDYDINRRLPHLRPALIYERERLDRVHAGLIGMAVGRGDRDAMILSVSRILTLMYEDIEAVPQRMGDFRINIGSLGTWIMMVRHQSLAIDAIYILPYDAPAPTNGRSWWRQIWHEIQTLFFSFIIDFNTIAMPGADGIERNIEVWIGTGRDQANVIKSMIDETFTRDTGIGVTLMLVDPATILPATVAGQGPDVTLSVWNTLPMDYGLRGAVADISTMPGFDEVMERFHPATMEAYEFEGRVFALPETMTFQMLFYRRDILHEIGLTPPETWDDVSAAIAHLGQFHMEFGMPVALPAMGAVPIDITDIQFMMFLYQRGGTLYNEDNTMSALDTMLSLNAFRDFTRFYTDYNLPVEFDFINRFRMGDMPMGIVDYTNYNVLQVFAPEIHGLWGFRPVPGTPQPDGSINRAVPVGGMAVVMMEDTNDRYASWDFMKWWTSADTQTMFGQRMESLMGSAARHPTANVEAFGRMPWPVADYQQISAQMYYVRGIPQIPGAYFTPRQIRNAFFSVTEMGDIGPREALTDFTRFINDEIRAKRREFGLD